MQRPWTLTSPPGIPPALMPFLQSAGDFAKLAEALKTTSSLLSWHPLVYRIIKQLRGVRREWAYDDGGLAYRAPEALRDLVGALVRSSVPVGR